MNNVLYYSVKLADVYLCLVKYTNRCSLTNGCTQFGTLVLKVLYLCVALVWQISFCNRFCDANGVN